MAGNEQFTEGFKKGQVGSTAMPHKMNSRTAERIEGLKDVLRGELTMAALKHGVGRETAHSAIRDHSVAVALDMRERGLQENDLLDRLAGDSRMGLPKKELEMAIANPLEFVGNAPRQITGFVEKVQKIVEKYPQAAMYVPEEIL